MQLTKMWFLSQLHCNIVTEVEISNTFELYFYTATTVLMVNPHHK